MPSSDHPTVPLPEAVEAVASADTADLAAALGELDLGPAVLRRLAARCADAVEHATLVAGTAVEPSEPRPSGATERGAKPERARRGSVSRTDADPDAPADTGVTRPPLPGMTALAERNARHAEARSSAERLQPEVDPAGRTPVAPDEPDGTDEPEDDPAYWGDEQAWTTDILAEREEVWRRSRASAAALDRSEPADEARLFEVEAEEETEEDDEDDLGPRHDWSLFDDDDDELPDGWFLDDDDEDDSPWAVGPEPARDQPLTTTSASDRHGDVGGPSADGTSGFEGRIRAEIAAELERARQRELGAGGGLPAGRGTVPSPANTAGVPAPASTAAAAPTEPVRPSTPARRSSPPADDAERHYVNALLRHQHDPRIRPVLDRHRDAYRAATDRDEKAVRVRALEMLASIPKVGRPALPDSATLRRRLDERLYGQAAAKTALARRFALARAAQRYEKPTAFRSILLTGPPGVGKTTFVQAAAEAAGLPFASVPLVGRSGIDLAGLTYHWSNPNPGLLVQALATLPDRCAVVLLDEVDKIPSSQHHGTPADVLLACIDDRRVVADAFCGCDIDVSSVLFVATANSPEAIHPALYDRFEVIALAPYTVTETIDIIQQFTFPKLAADYCEPGQVVLDPQAAAVLGEHCAEAGGLRAAQTLCAALLADVADDLHPGGPVIEIGPDAARAAVAGDLPDVEGLPGSGNGASGSSRGPGTGGAGRGPRRRPRRTSGSGGTYGYL